MPLAVVPGFHSLLVLVGAQPWGWDNIGCAKCNTTCTPSQDCKMQGNLARTVSSLAQGFIHIVGIIRVQ